MILSAVTYLCTCNLHQQSPDVFVQLSNTNIVVSVKHS